MDAILAGEFLIAIKDTTVLIAGAGIAGPATALWLGRQGFRVTVVEVAPGIRSGGSTVDFRGEVQLALLARMGVLADLRACETGGTALRFVDAQDRLLLEVPAGFAGGDLEVMRGELSRVLHEHSREHVEYILGDSITHLTDTAQGVHVTFTSGARRWFDLVIGADGVHSNVRTLAFGPASRFVTHLGHYVSAWDAPNDLGVGRDALMFNVPGKLASVGGDHRDPTRACAFFAFASPALAYDRRDRAQQRGIIRDVFSGLGWHVPYLLEAMDDTPDLYFDAICRVDVPAWSQGRIALIGDAACGATIGGMGTGVAIVAAYVLAGELARADGDHAIAYRRYEERLRPFARRCQRGGDGTGRFLAPSTAWGIRLRNGLLNRRPVMAMLLRMAKDRSKDVVVPQYAMA